MWLQRANYVRDQIKRAYDYDSAPIVIESEDLEKAKRIEDFNKGIINCGRL